MRGGENMSIGKSKYSFSGKIHVSNSKIPKKLYIHQKEAMKELTEQSKKDKFKSLLVIQIGRASCRERVS